MAETIGKGLNVPAVSIPAEESDEHLGSFFGHAATMDIPASSEQARKTLRWEPAAPRLIQNLALRKYF
jgi:hypothetical protein